MTLLPGAADVRAAGRGSHSSTFQLNLSRFVTETTAESAHVRPKSGRLCTAVFGPYIQITGAHTCPLSSSTWVM